MTDKFNKDCLELGKKVNELLFQADKATALITVCSVFGSLVKIFDVPRKNAHNTLDSVLDDVGVE
jgi:hypothetical protein